MNRLWLALASVLACQVGLCADEPYRPKVAEASPEAELALHRFRIPEGWRAELVAAEPALANPVAFCFDEQGRIYVAETFRQQKGVEDNRGHMDWLLDDLAAQTVADRVAFFQKRLGPKVEQYAVEHDRIRLLIDRDGDSRMDEDRVFADGFHAIEDGTGAGVLALDGAVYYTCIPKLWKLEDKNQDGVADERTALHDGYGVRVAFRGHDLHGLALGPDGRLYFSIGDRGFHLETPQGVLALPDQGAVFRCELDGSHLEVFASGLRNPQELAFDDYGNLFTGDNNSDSGDKARWVYVMEGGDSGWRMYYQYLPDRGPWNRERLWHPPHPGQAAYIVPPIAHLADGPSGLAHYPGVGLSERYRDHFFLADFRGTAANSGVRSFAVRPRGAGFELVDQHEFVWSILATDVDFGYDGALYVSDWVDGWDGLGKGRIYRFVNPARDADPLRTSVPKLFQDGFRGRKPSVLRELLAHPDSRVRQRAQFALADWNGAPELLIAVRNGGALVERLHALWGLWQVGRRHPVIAADLLFLLDDPEAEIRGQAARVLGELGMPAAIPALIAALRDSSPRVRSFAATALGRLQAAEAFSPLVDALAENADGDPFLRHALVMGLVGTKDVARLADLRAHASPAVRLGAVVALRRLRSPELARFVTDAEPLVALEAERAIHDLPVAEALPAVAQLAERPGLSEALARRALNANFRLGTAAHAAAVANLAAAELPEALRLEALAELENWNAPPPLDRVTNEFRPLPPRAIDVAAVLRPQLAALLAGPASVRTAAAQLAAKYEIRDVEPFLTKTVATTSAAPAERVAALQALVALKAERLEELVATALRDAAPAVRSAARQAFAQLHPDERAVAVLREGFREGTPREQQAAIRTLAALRRPEADRVLQEGLERLLQGELAAEVRLDVLDAAAQRDAAALKRLIAEFEAQRNGQDHLAAYRETLAGGDADRGRDIFFGRSEVSCRRCHKIAGDGGEVGPDLTRIGAEKTREYLLESIVDPNRQIAKGFETIVLQTDDGKVHAGVVKQDDGDRLLLQTVDRGVIAIDKRTIEDRAVGKSGMPEDLVKKLTKAELRDLVEFLAALRGGAAEHGRSAAAAP